MCVIGGFTFKRSGFPPLVGVGFGIAGAAMIVLLIAAVTHQSCFTTNLNQAIAKESVKYSTRQPTPCSWRLDSSGIYSSAQDIRTAARNLSVSHMVSS